MHTMDWLDESVHKADRHSLLSIVISFLFKVILYRIVGRYIFLVNYHSFILNLIFA